MNIDAIRMMEQILSGNDSDKLKRVRKDMQARIVDGTADDATRANIDIMTRILKDRRDLTDCSFCPTDAEYVGRGQDGDFYCEGHTSRAPGGIDPVY